MSFAGVDGGAAAQAQAPQAPQPFQGRGQRLGDGGAAAAMPAAGGRPAGGAAGGGRGGNGGGMAFGVNFTFRRGGAAQAQTQQLLSQAHGVQGAQLPPGVLPGYQPAQVIVMKASMLRNCHWDGV